MFDPVNPAQKSSAGFSARNLDCLVDLHLHLDGAISLESAKQLAALQNIEIPESDEELLEIMRVKDDCSDLNDFLTKFAFPCSLLQTKDGIRQATARLLAELKKQNMMYAEIRFAPQKSTDMGLSQEEAVVAALEGIASSAIPSGLILCCMRGNDNEKENKETVEVAGKYLGKGVVAVDLAGAESLFPTGDFAPVFALAREKGIPITIHAGEADGPKSVCKALKMGACRIGHGVRSLEDPSLVRELADKKIPLELCPTSNVNTALCKDIAHWPFRELLSSGMVLTINTDDPSIEGTSLWEEYQKLIDTFGIGEAEIKSLLTNAVNASFAEDSLKKAMLDKIERRFPR